MKKNLLILFTGIAAIIISSQIFINNFIKKEVLANVAQSINSKVSLSSVSLSRFSSLVIRNIKINDPTLTNRNIFEIEKINISFKPLQFLQTKDIMKSITSIKVTNGNAIIHHYKDDSFNLISLLRQSESTTQNAQADHPPEFDIKFRKCSLTYIDERGFGPQPFKEGKTHRLFDLTAAIDLTKEQTKIKAKGTLNKTENNVEIAGAIRKGDYQINIHTDQSEISDIINYFVNMPELTFTNAVGEVDVSLKPNQVIKKTDIPIAIDVSVNIREGTLKTKWLPPLLSITGGKVLVSNKGVFIKHVQGVASNEEFEVNGDILEFYKLNLNIVANNLKYKNAYGFLPFLQYWNLNGSGPFTFKLFTDLDKELVMSGKVHNYTGNIFQYTVNNTDLSFSMKKNKINLEIPVIHSYMGSGMGQGTVILRDQKAPIINMQISLKDVSIHDYFQSPQFLNKGNLELLLYNTGDDIKGTVLFSSNTATVFGQDLKAVTLFWNKKADRLLFLKNSFASLNSLKSKVFFDGYLDNKHYFDININNKIYPIETNNFYFFSSKIGTYSFDSSIQGNFKGYFNDAFKKNPLDTTTGKCVLTNANFHTDFLKTDILSGNGQVIIDKFVFIDMNLKNNHSAINIHAKTSNKGLIHSLFSLENIAMVHSKSFVKTSAFDYYGYASGKINLFPSQNDLFIKNYGVTGNFIITNTSIITSNFVTQNIHYLSGDINLNNGLLQLNNAHLIQSITNAKFDLSYESIKQFSINFYNSRLQSNEIVYVPNTIKLFFKNLDGHISRKQENYTLSLNIDTNFISYKSLDIPNVKGSIQLHDSLLSFNNLDIYNKEDIYNVSGNLTTEFSKKKTINFKPKYTLDCRFIKGRLENLSELYQRLRPLWTEDNKKIITASDKDTQKKINILLNYNKLIQKNYVNLYSLKENSVAKLLDSIKIKEQQEILNDLPSAEGSITGYLHLSNTDNFQFYSNLSILSGRIIYGFFDSLKLLAKQKNDDIDIDINCNNLTILDNLFEEINASAMYTPDTQKLSISNLSTTFKGNKSNNILSGKVNLASLFKEEKKARLMI